jgi:hypothetical protein
VYHGSALQQLVDQVADKMIVFSDTGFKKMGIRPIFNFVNEGN